MEFKAPTLRETVIAGCGAASMCWSPRPTGVFDAERAIEVAEAVLEEVPYKYLEVYDTKIYIAVYAFRIEPLPMLRPLGFRDNSFIAMMTLTGEECATSPGVWSDRWYSSVHQTIIDRWDTLKSGDVLDMRSIREEAPK